MTVKFTLDSREVPDGMILLFGIRYAGADPEGYARTAEEESEVYTYAMLKAGGLWYVSGTNVRNPQAAGWGAIERWLERDGRVVEWVRHVTETAQLWPPVDTSQEAKTIDDLSDGDDEHTESGYPDDPPLGSCRNYPHCNPKDCPDHGSARP